ncbi:MAG: L-serine ammonia-lyase, iron-sulfur-dependent, subunit alpha [Bacillota bacterium]|nr:L-serine ammonia-lyase, iron-sulfur-dependent, subunit alpha [Bacillota bacterium]
MNKLPPSIFNDVIGPVMRGPSSSHTAASVRIGRIINQYVSGEIKSCIVEFTPSGSLATTYHGQGTDIGIAAGLLGLNTDEKNLVNSLNKVKTLGIDLKFQIVDYQAKHPNTYRIRVVDKDNLSTEFLFLSTGGGMIELLRINNFEFSIKGDNFVTLFFISDSDLTKLNNFTDTIESLIPGKFKLHHASDPLSELFILETADKLPPGVLNSISKLRQDLNLPGKTVELDPVMPVRSIVNDYFLYPDADKLYKIMEKNDQPLWKIAVQYESARGSITEDDVIQFAENLARVMKNSVVEGLSGTKYDNRILGAQAANILKSGQPLLGGAYLKKIIAYSTAVMEVKSAMGTIVAAPTAGSCGVLPGALITTAEELEISDQNLARAVLAAGIIGVLIAWKSTFAAEECGCQAECGSASAMSAAALVQMTGGSPKQAMDAAALALQSILGLACDPVADRVEVPCLGKNILAALNAVAAANMSLAGFDKVIPLDESIEALDQVGRLLPPELCCTGKAGLSITRTAQAIHKHLGK